MKKRTSYTNQEVKGTCAEEIGTRIKKAQLQLQLISDGTY